MSVDEVLAALTALCDAYDTFDRCDLDTLTSPQLLQVLDRLQTLGCQLPTQDHRILARLRAETTPAELGAKSWRDVLATRYRLSTAEAGRRLTDADHLGPRQSLTGEPMAPRLAATAAAQRLGLITGEHVTVIRTQFKKVPGWVDGATRDQIEVDWVRHAVGCGPTELENLARRTVFLLDQDGPAPDDTERARRRSLVFGRQQDDAMTGVKGNLTPSAYAVWEALDARFSARGMCNPADEHPCTTGTPTQDQIDGDLRTLEQRRHDAFEYIGRMALDKTERGQHGGLPTTIIVRTTLQELATRAGIGVTGGGTLIPVADVLNLAARKDATNYLAVFDDATGAVLDLFRTRRTASVAQRLALIARDGGCTKPGCTVPAYRTQVHHAAADWSNGGDTNVDDLTLACGPDNRAVGPGGWTTRLTDTHHVEWIPPPGLDTGQTRTNDYHHPETLRPPPQDAWQPPEWQPPTPTAGADDAAVTAPDPATNPTTDEQHRAEPWPPEHLASIADEPADYERLDHDDATADSHGEPIPWWPVDPAWQAAEAARATRERATAQPALAHDAPSAPGPEDGDAENQALEEPWQRLDTADQPGDTAIEHPNPPDEHGDNDTHEPGAPAPPTSTAA
ncbi:HNH endonuclease signature motif containing protein [Mycolicibacterium sediminis]|uniref:DUF222 domain-containing protein n=1 Tax=Mycolicibacterium sediminis TaxID=1286180 RepID=A0A7I7QZB9_9MYCO|nr:HNH endonuclease signature motif containing protein [Mycolicibacterium sediminis]BBY31691.1 hypothetical protein MSEDJ_57870 [Mycolicibacterium sediminis]